MCAWGAPAKGGAEWVKRLKADDPSFTSLHVLPFRRLQTSEWREVFEALALNTTLKEFYASGHILEEEALSALGAALAENRGLWRLCVGHAELGSAAGFKALCEGMGKNRAITHWDLDYKGIGAGGRVEDLAQALASEALEEVILSRNGLSDGHIATLAVSLSGLPHLRKLDLGTNTLTDPSPLLPLLTGPSSRLEELILSGCPLGDAGATALGQAVAQSTSLRSLEVSGIPGEDAAVLPYGDALIEGLVRASKRTTFLQRLWIDRVGISVAGAGSLGKWLAPGGAGSTLREIRLRGDALGDEGVTALFPTPPHSTLESVEIGENGITDAALLPLLTALADVKKVGVFGNQITAVDAAAILPEGGSIQQLDLGGNQIGAAGISSLCEALSAKPSILPGMTLLELGGNLVEGSEEVWKGAVASLATSRPSLQVPWKK